MQKTHELLAQVASSLLHISRNDVIDRVVEDALQLLGRHVRADRAYLFFVDRERQTLSNTHEWCDEGISPEKEYLQNLPLYVFPWFIRHLELNRILDIPDTNALPPEASVEREGLQAQGIQSLLAAAVMDDAGLCAFIGFDAVKSLRNWEVEQAELLSVMGDMLKSAIDRHRELVMLERAQERFSAIFEEGRDAVLIFDRDGRFHLANRAACALTGYSQTELKGMRLPELHDDFDLYAVSAYLKRVLSGEKIFFDAPLKRKDGTRCAAEFSSSRVLLEGDFYVHTSIRDVSDRVTHLNSLRYSEKLLRMIVRNAQTLMMDHSTQALASAVQAFGESVGADACFVLKRIMESRSSQPFAPVQVWMRDPESAQLRSEQFAGCLSEYAPWRRRMDVGLPVLWPESTRVKQEPLPESAGDLAAVHVLPIVVRGEIWGALCFLFNERKECAQTLELEAIRLAALFIGTVIELRSQQQRLSESEERYRGIFSQAYDAIFLVDERCQIWDANERGFEILQCSRFDLLSKTVGDFCTPQTRTQLQNVQRELIRTGSVMLTTELKGLEGTVLPVEISAKRIQDSPRTYQCVVRDISVHRQMHQYLLEQIEAERTRFGQEMHDGVCQDLKSLDIQMQVLLHTVERTAPEQAEFVRKLGKLCNALVGQAYGVARGLLPPAIGAEPAANILDGLLGESESMYGCRMIREGFEQIPALEPRVVAHVYRIIQESIKNAVVHGRATEIRFRAEAQERDFAMEITDNGVGDSSGVKRSSFGGMGIEVMRSRVASVGGYLEVVRGEGKGCTVKFVIPQSTREP